MRHPGSVVAGADFPEFVLPHFFERLLVGYGIALDRNLRAIRQHEFGPVAEFLDERKCNPNVRN